MKSLNLWGTQWGTLLKSFLTIDKRKYLFTFIKFMVHGRK